MKVTQKDRDDAADLWLALSSEATADEISVADAIRRGEQDFVPAVKWMAGHNATTRAELAAKNAEIARLRAELSSMATKYSWAVDTFGTGFSGYEAVLLHQKRYAEEGHPSNWRDSMKEYAARAALTEPTDEA